jgi:AraC-like DNA-binding protein
MSDQEMYEDIQSVEEVIEEETQESDEAVEVSEEADEVSEAKNGVESPEAAIGSVNKAARAVKSKAKVPGGEAVKAQPAEKMPSTKAGMINAMYSEMSKMKKSDLQAGYGKIMAQMKMKVHEDAEAEDFDADDIHEKAAAVSVDVTADMNALVESEATLSESFKDKAAVIMEAAVKSKVSEEVSRIESELQEEFDEELKTTREEMVEQIDGYLSYVVEKFMEENKLAIESGLRAELAEDFMVGLKNLFTESYVDVPESKVDLVDELQTQVNDLEEKLNESTETSIYMYGELEALKRDAIIREHSRDLAETQVEKLKALAEDVDFEDEETFAQKVSTIKESYFTKKTPSVVGEEVVEEVEEEEVSDSMARYVSAIKRTVKQ